MTREWVSPFAVCTYCGKPIYPYQRWRSDSVVRDENGKQRTQFIHVACAKEKRGW